MAHLGEEKHLQFILNFLNRTRTGTPKLTGTPEQIERARELSDIDPNTTFLSALALELDVPESQVADPGAVEEVTDVRAVTFDMEDAGNLVRDTVEELEDRFFVQNGRAPGSAERDEFRALVLDNIFREKEVGFDAHGLFAQIIEDVEGRVQAQPDAPTKERAFGITLNEMVNAGKLTVSQRDTILHGTGDSKLQIDAELFIVQLVAKSEEIRQRSGPATGASFTISVRNLIAGEQGADVRGEGLFPRFGLTANEEAVQALADRKLFNDNGKPRSVSEIVESTMNARPEFDPELLPAGSTERKNLTAAKSILINQAEVLLEEGAGSLEDRTRALGAFIQGTFDDGGFEALRSSIEERGASIEASEEAEAAFKKARTKAGATLLANNFETAAGLDFGSIPTDRIRGFVQDIFAAGELSDELGARFVGNFPEFQIEQANEDFDFNEFLSRSPFASAATPEQIRQAGNFVDIQGGFGFSKQGIAEGIFGIGEQAARQNQILGFGFEDPQAVLGELAKLEPRGFGTFAQGQRFGQGAAPAGQGDALQTGGVSSRFGFAPPTPEFQFEEVSGSVFSIPRPAGPPEFTRGRVGRVSGGPVGSGGLRPLVGAGLFETLEREFDIANPPNVSRGISISAETRRRLDPIDEQIRGIERRRSFAFGDPQDILGFSTSQELDTELAELRRQRRAIRGPVSSAPTFTSFLARQQGNLQEQTTRRRSLSRGTPRFTRRRR